MNIMFFDEEFISNAEQNPIEAISEACEKVFKRLGELETGAQNWSTEEHELLWEVASLVDLILETNQISSDWKLPEPTGDINQNCTELQKYLEAIQDIFKEQSVKLKIKSYKKRYNTAFKASFAYEFTQGDLDRIQVLINELREQITDCKKFEDGHKRRLLKRLEKLQSEMHKRVSDLDKFWGLIGDSGVVLGKLGTDAKPIVDRIKEIAEIVWKTQARTEELPSQAQNPILEQDDNT